MSVRDDLERLALLQAAELEGRACRAALDALPAERDARKARVRTAAAAVKDAENEREESQKEHRRLEAELQGAEAQVNKYREQELEVKTNEQLWAIQAEIKTVQDKIGAIEERILEELERADELAGAIEERKRDQAAAEKVTAGELAEIDEREKKITGRLETAQAEAERLRGETAPEALAFYDRVAAVRGGVAMAEGIDGRCQACNVRLRPQVWVGVLNMSELVQCDACKRIVFSRQELGLPSAVKVTGD